MKYRGVSGHTIDDRFGRRNDPEIGWSLRAQHHNNRQHAQNTGCGFDANLDFALRVSRPISPFGYHFTTVPKNSTGHVVPRSIWPHECYCNEEGTIPELASYICIVVVGSTTTKNSCVLCFVFCVCVDGLRLHKPRLIITYITTYFLST